MFGFTAQHVVIKFPERTLDCPEPKVYKSPLYFYNIIIYVLTAILNFSYKFFKSFVISKTEVETRGIKFAVKLCRSRSSFYPSRSNFFGRVNGP